MRKKVIFFTFIVWFAFAVAYAFHYVRSRLNLPDLKGYEAEWGWQILFFCLVRLPWLVLVLVVVIVVEYRGFKQGR